MKTLTTIMSAAILVAGITIAGAQDKSVTEEKPVNNPTTGQSSQMNKSMQDKSKVIGNAAFCIETQGGQFECKFASAAECAKQAKVDSLPDSSCSANPNRTTGQQRN